MPPFPDHRGLAFPRNLYTRLLELEEGQAEYLHYGLFNAPDLSVGSAQARSVSLLLENLPPPCKLLKVGIGLGKTEADLIGAGYQVTGIAPDAARIDYALGRYPDLSSHLRCCSLEDFPGVGDNWDMLLFHESAQHIDTVDLFELACRLLKGDGEMLVMGEFALSFDSPGQENLHLLEYFLRLAERFGFSITQQQDLSAQAAPTLDWLLYAANKYANRLKADGDVTDEQLALLIKSIRHHRENYASGKYGYFLLRLRRTAQPRWQIGRVLANRSQEMRNLFFAVFGHEMSAEHWQWKYGDGRGSGIGVWRTTDGEMVAHYGGMGRNVLLFGQPQSAVQIGDVMVNSNDRGVLTRSGPFFLTTATFLERYIGFGKPFLLGFGFPTSRHMRLAEKYGLYADTGGVTEVNWQPAACRPFFLTHVRAYDSGNPADRAQLDALWEEMAAGLRQAIVGVRNAEHIDHRYLRHPNKHYRVLWVAPRWIGEPLGLMVLRQEGEAVELLDLVAPLHRIPLLVAHARRLAGCDGATRVYCWIGEGFQNRFLCGGGVAQALDIRIPANAWSNGPLPETLQNRWWVMSGDTDFR